VVDVRSGLHSANAHSSIVEQLISKAEWFFPGGLSVRLSVCLSVCLFVCLSVSASKYVSVVL